MAKITLYNEQPLAATYVPNIFIDEYMTQANGEYVKIYLYLLRSISQPECSFSLSQIADHFDCTERDVLRALKYWEKRQSQYIQGFSSSWRQQDSNLRPFTRQANALPAELCLLIMNYESNCVKK